ncbi:hypothetical protein D3C73_1217780 [compost metagenome]
MDLVHAALFEVSGEVFKKCSSDFLRGFEFRCVRATSPYAGVGPVAEIEVRLRLAANQVRLDFLAFCVKKLGETFSLLEHARGVGSCKAAVRCNDQDCGAADLLRLGGQRVVDFALSCDSRNGAGNRVRVRQ